MECGGDAVEAATVQGGGHSSTSTETSKVKSLTILSYHQRLDSTVEKITDNYLNLIKAAKIGDKVQVTEDEFQTDVHTADLVSSAESLLMLISELRQAALLHDFEARNAEVTTRARQLRNCQRKTNEVLSALHKDIHDTLVGWT